jgi:excisionase family DNA binding protein
MKKENKTDDRKLLSVTEVAKRFGLAKKTVYNQLSQGLFPVKHKKIGRLVKFDSIEVEKFIESLPDFQ